MYKVYIIHFEKPFHHAKHYIGMTGEGLLERFKRHKQGGGAKITSAVVKAGIKLRCLMKIGEFETAGEARQFEIRLKKRKESKRFCSICKSGQSFFHRVAEGLKKDSCKTCGSLTYTGCVCHDKH